LKASGNTKGNKIWEGNLGSHPKPAPKDDRSKKEKFIRAK